MQFQLNWQPPTHWQKIKVIDMHTGGEPLRIVVDGLPEIKGHSVLEKRRYFQQHYDHLRTGLMFEPRGHADMYGAIVSAPSTPEADFDVFFIHNEGYSTMCGHAVIALTKFAFETGMIKKRTPAQLIINVPAGTVYAEATIAKEKVIAASFRNVPSYLYLRDQEVKVAGLGNIRFDIAFGGAFYAFVEAAPLDLPLRAQHYNQLIDYGRRIKYAVMEQFDIQHPTEPDLSFLYGTIFTDTAVEAHHHSRNVCIFAAGEVDRSATGSGVSARAGLHFAKGELAVHQPITIESILGSTMTVEVVDTLNFHGFEAVVPKVSGTAHFTGTSEFWFDPEDAYREGFIFR
jgi:proline racemase